MRTKPSFEFENEYWERNSLVAGADEVGRGSFAGPVVAACVLFSPGFTAEDSLFEKINDSKLVTPHLREKLAEFIKTIATYSISEVSVEEINIHGIGEATKQAIIKAVRALTKRPDTVLIDGYALKNVPFRQMGIIKGDRKSISIASASIIAKVYRDNLMRSLHDKYAIYDFASNKGYGTAHHREMIRKHGLCELHRTAFCD